MEDKTLYIYNHKGKPSDKSFLIAIPVYMYTIRTNCFTDGLNFFQRSVLRFMEKPGISVKTIAEFLHLSENLVQYIQEELRNKRCIDDKNLLTEEGRTYLLQSRGIVADFSNSQIGHIFQFCDRNEFYPFYVNKFTVCDAYYSERKKQDYLFIETNNEENPILKMELFKLEVNPSKSLFVPTEQQVLQLMENRQYQESVNGGLYVDDGVYEEMSFDTMMCKENSLNISFLSNETPELVYLCTYIYREEIKDGIYDDQWKILDPFTDDFNPGLRFYIKSLGNETLDNFIDMKFNDVLTCSDGDVIESDKYIKGKVNKILSEEIGVFPVIDADDNHHLENNVKNALEGILLYNIKKDDSSRHQLIVFTQKIVEQVLEIDKEERKSLYDQVDRKWFANYSFSRGKERSEYKDLSGAGGSDFKNHIRQDLQYHMPNRHRKDDPAYKKLLNISQRFNNKDGLFKKLYTLLLCWEEDNNATLIILIEKHLDFIMTKCSRRNVESHATLDKIPDINEDELLEYRNFIIEFTKEYIKTR